MNCEDARSHLRDLPADRLDPATRDAVRAHLGSCAGCSRGEAAERALDALLRQRLPRHAAPPALRRRLAALARPGAVPAPPDDRSWKRWLAPGLAACLALALGALLVDRVASRGGGALASLAGEAVNDHLRVLAALRPLEIESGGAHQVKPWFEGKLDFAPVVPTLEDGSLRLQGGSVGYLFDRKAAVLVYALRRHAVTLLVFRAEGIPALEAGGAAGARTAAARGFQVVLWRGGDLGYALVSDVSADELAGLAGSLAAATAH
jgi:anti-sigma factor RsiW